MNVTSINNWTLIMDDGSYETSIKLNIDISMDLDMYNSNSFVVRGANNGKNTTLVNKISCCGTRLFYAYIDEINDQRPDVFLKFQHFTYVSQYEFNQQFGYFYYVKDVSLSNVIFDMSNSYNGYNFVELYYINSLAIENVQFYGLLNCTNLFYSKYSSSVSMKNILVDGNDYTNSSIHNNNILLFARFDSIRGDLYFENVTIMNHGIENVFHVDYSSSSSSSIHLMNIVLDNVFGTETFFVFDSQRAAITMENIYVDGHGNTISDDLIYYSGYSGSNITIDNSIFANFVFNAASTYSSAVPFYFHSDGNKILFDNVTFRNLTTFDDYRLIYIREECEIEIIHCVFENNFGFVGLIQCESWSFCNVTINNSVFINNDYGYSRSVCYNDKPIINSIYFADNAYATLVVTQNTFYFYGPTVIYDNTSSVTIVNNEIIDQVSSDDYDCDGTAATLYLSNNGTSLSDEENDCTDIDNPCSTWFSIMESVRSGDTIKIDNGQYDVYDSFEVDTFDALLFDNNFVNYTIMGNGKEKTTLLVDKNVDQFLYVWLYDYYTSLKISDLTYYREQGTYGQLLGYFCCTAIIHFSNIIVNGQLSDTYSSYGLIFGYQLEALLIDNMEIYDTNGWSTLFVFFYADVVKISNVLVSTDSYSSDSDIEFGYFYRCSGCNVDLENITIKNYNSSGTFDLYDFYYCDIRLNNITLDNVYGGVFFYFDGYAYCDIVINDVLADGNDKDLQDGILYVSSNRYSNATLDISNSIFRNYQINVNRTKVFNFWHVNSSCTRSNCYDTIFNNVIFENMQSTSTSAHGLIYVSHDFNIKFSNCTFRNNIGFVAMIHCEYKSYCQILIENSTFYNNNGGYYNCMYSI